MLDSGALEALGITAMGFTQKVSADDTTSGTPLYLAPEVIAGQPFTVQSDIYALGVMLYQLVAGDTHKSLAPGWEKDVADELLREDIAQTAAGNPADRLGDAALLAQRLRTLTQRRQIREEDRTRQAQTERAQRMRQELKRLRVIAAVLLLLTGAVTAAGVIAFKSRNEARQAVETTQAVNQFLNNDLLASADPRQGPTKDLTVRQLLDRASETVDERFKGQPEAAAQVHVTVGVAYMQLGEVTLAHSHLERATALYTELHGPTALKTLDTRGLLAGAVKATGRLKEGCAITREVQLELDRQLDPADDRRLEIRAASAECLFNLGAIQQAIPEISAVVTELEQRQMTDNRWYTSSLYRLAKAYFDRFNHVDSEAQYRKLVAHSSRTLGTTHITTARFRANWAGALIFSGRVAEADTELHQAIEDQRNWIGEESGDIGNLTLWLAILRIEQGRAKDAEVAALRCLGSALGQQERGGFRVAVLYNLSEARYMQGRLDDAVQGAEETIALSRELGYAKLWYELSARAFWADALRLQGKEAEAWRVLSTITAEDIAALPDRTAAYALFKRSQGLLWVKEGKTEQARAALRDSLEIYEFRYGADHWRTKRARAELVRAPAAS